MKDLFKIIRKGIQGLSDLPRPAKIGWFLLFLVGLLGVLPRLFFGHFHTGYGSYVVWGLWVSEYIWLIGLSAGAFLLSSVIYLFRVEILRPYAKLALLTALSTLLTALLAIWFDLGHEWRFFYVFLYPNFSSMMAWMVWLYTAYFILILAKLLLEQKADVGLENPRKIWLLLAGCSAVAIVVLGLLPTLIKLTYPFDLTLRGGYEERILDLRNGLIMAAFLCTILSLYLALKGVKPSKALPILGLIGIPVATAFHGGVGALFATNLARPGWHSALVPILFLTGALLSGTGLFAFLVDRLPMNTQEQKKEAMKFLARILMILLFIDLLLEWSEITVPLWYGIESPEQKVWNLILFGPYWWVFWIVHGILGSLIPLFVLLFRSENPRAVGLSGFLLAFTYMAVRLNIVIPSLVIPELELLKKSYTDQRLKFEYVPNLHEWLVALFVVMVAVLIFSVFWLGLKDRMILKPQGKEG